MSNNLAAATALSPEPHAGSTLNVLGVTQIYKVTGAETGGSLSFWEAVIPPGAGAPPHTHSREHEAFYVLRGEILIEREGAPAPLTSARVGSSLVPAGAITLSAMPETRPLASLSSAPRAAGLTKCSPSSKPPALVVVCRFSVFWWCLLLCLVFFFFFCLLVVW